MRRTFFCATALALSFGGLAMAQTDRAPTSARSAPDAPPPAASAADPSADAAAAFTPGMPVQDPSGQTVGVISRVGKTAEGVPAAELNVDGKPITIALANLSLAPTRDHAVTSATKAQVQAAARQAPG